MFEKFFWDVLFSQKKVDLHSRPPPPFRRRHFYNKSTGVGVPYFLVYRPPFPTRYRSARPWKHAPEDEATNWLAFRNNKLHNM
jgi:hypothetical protein